MTIIELRDKVKAVLTKHGRPTEHFYVQTTAWEYDKEQQLHIHCYGLNKSFMSDNPNEIPKMVEAYLTSKPSEPITI